ncbi:MAG: hypothetical protein M1338_05800 [Patescibacteria group bacterium]|nr:hypothetical protein [Patescibacteria group bacterium]
MITNDPQFGYQIYGKSIGETWLNLVEAILFNGESSFDEGRERLAIMNVRIKSETQNISDQLIAKYAENEKTKAMIDFTFSKEIIEDIDVIKSFQQGAKSYHQRISTQTILHGRLKDISKTLKEISRVI